MHSDTKQQSSSSLTSDVACEPRPDGRVTAREIDLQQQRHCALRQFADEDYPGGYLAVCAIVKNQARELPEWLDYHRRLGVSHFYIVDDHSTPPLNRTLGKYIKEGLVTHRLVTDAADEQQAVKRETCHEPHIHHRQLLAYSRCLLDFGTRHHWMAFIDVDEFFVFRSNLTTDLPSFLRDYESYGGLAVNWHMFGSSGHKKRQKNTLLAYTKCYPPHNPENTHIKTVVNLKYVARIAGPHDAYYPPGYFTVNPSLQPVEGPLSQHVDFSRLVLHHYVLKSKEEFQEKQPRGDVMGDAGKLRDRMDFWNRVEAGSTETCRGGAAMLSRLRQRPAGD